MPTYELIGVGANGRPDVLKLSALSERDAIAEANRLHFKVSGVRDTEAAVHKTTDLSTRQLEAIEFLCNSAIVRKPVRTIATGIILAGLFPFLLWIILAFAQAAADRADAAAAEASRRETAQRELEAGMRELRFMGR